MTWRALDDAIVRGGTFIGAVSTNRPDWRENAAFIAEACNALERAREEVQFRLVPLTDSRFAFFDVNASLRQSNPLDGTRLWDNS